MTSLQGARASRPLAARMRPRTLDDVVGQSELRRPGTPLWRLCHPTEGERTPASVILFGPPGTGKTTLAHVIATEGQRRFIELSAISAGVKDVRRVMEQAQADRDLYGTQTVLFLDEIHRFTKAQQDSLLPGVEDGIVTLVAATTENPSFSVISPLLSRSLLLRLTSLSDDDLLSLIDRAIVDERGLHGAVAIDDEARTAIVELASGDARRALTLLEAAAGQADADIASAEKTDDADSSEQARLPRITAAVVAIVADRALVRYDQNGDQHYDVVSAFIKSIRGSDVDAAVHYLARMIEGGEDSRFIARRLMISAAEDIGTADPQALSIAVAAAQTVAMVGMPEGRIPLAEATVYLASAPKSNAAYLAIDRAIADIRAGEAGDVPSHLRDAHYKGARALGHGIGYQYPHDEPTGVSAQQYLPDTLQGRRYYEPTGHGFDATIGRRLDQVRRLLAGLPMQRAAQTPTAKTAGAATAKTAEAPSGKTPEVPSGKAAESSPEATADADDGLEKK
ncbi:replication-associated recombination protein A [Pseudoclavibacter sp. CFCC 13796]|uniref:replication-associated recombination protein A n=1 Tax=Pseudoclavibacter sp. CFCC 13796 TaxID=2615179 RepID=UPI0013015BF0|nr:replication-associated recombination protein A [Pseudoclavibacter sp. CFCC 13796]KAB1661868.1 replication-associated recombination protein A [Pseudoclavibacter sp. CFCC 13796]